MIGGSNQATGEVLATSEAFNAAGDTFSPGPTLNLSRVYHTATSLANDSVLVAGGGSPGLGRVSSAEQLIPPPSANAGPDVFAAVDAMVSATITLSGS